MSLELVRAFFGWTSVINFGALLPPRVTSGGTNRALPFVRRVPARLLISCQ